jgi:plasmid maintenance system antidote protein VapI
MSKQQKTGKTMTELLRKALAEAKSLRSVANATGLTVQSLSMFVRGKQSLRLDMADKLAAHFRIRCTQERGK